MKNREHTESKMEMEDLSTNISTITLNVNDLNIPIKDRDWSN